MTSREFLKTLAPSFMWCSAFDLFLMFEHINEDYRWETFRCILHNMEKEGYFETKPGTNAFRNGPQPRLFLRKER